MGFREIAENQLFATAEKSKNYLAWSKMLARLILEITAPTANAKSGNFNLVARRCAAHPLIGVSKYTYRKFDRVRRLGRITCLNEAEKWRSLR
jgi:hypothetical protein